MKTRVRKTSVDAYHSLTAKESQSYRIFMYIEDNEPVSIGEIAKALGMEKSTVSARMNELVNGKKDREGNWLKEPTVEEAGRWKDSVSGVRTIHWKVQQKKPSVQRELFNNWSNT